MTRPSPAHITPFYLGSFTRHDRQRLSAVIGERAERLAFLSCVLDECIQEFCQSTRYVGTQDRERGKGVQEKNGHFVEPYRASNGLHPRGEGS